MSARTRFWLFAFSLIAFPGLAWAQKTPGYTFYQVNFPDSYETFVIAINDRPGARGDIVGTYRGGPHYRQPFVKWGSTYQDLTIPGLDYFEPMAINNSRVITGSALVGPEQTGFEHVGASKEHPAKITTPVKYPSSSYTYAAGVNDAGDIVGHYVNSLAITEPGYDPLARPFILQGDTYTALPLIPGFDVYPTDINNVGQIVGSIYNWDTGEAYGFLYERGEYQFFTPPPARTGSSDLVQLSVRGINDHGHIVGSYWEPYEEDDPMFECCWRGYLLKNGVFTTINATNDSQTQVVGINNAGHIAGTHWRFYTWDGHGFIAVPKSPPQVVKK
jgi:uncharacterized membrane protein